MLTLIRCPFHPVLPQWHVEDPGHSAESAGGSLHRNTHTPLTQRSRSRSRMTMPPSRHSVGTYPETSLHATCEGTFGHSRLSSLSHCGLILALRVEFMYANELISTSKTKKKEKRAQAWNEWPNILPKSSQAREKPPPLAA